MRDWKILAFLLTTYLKPRLILSILVSSFVLNYEKITKLTHWWLIRI